LQAELKDGNNVPMNTSTGRQAEAGFDSGTKVVTYTGTCSDLHGPGAVDKNAGTAPAFRSASSPIKGTGTFSDMQAADLLGDKFDANIHSAAIAELRTDGEASPRLFLISVDMVRVAEAGVRWSGGAEKQGLSEQRGRRRCRRPPSCRTSMAAKL
jgi:hypothetical protein